MRTSIQRAKLSPLIGKTVFIRHATETDLAFIGERFKKRGLDTEGIHASQFVTAVEDDRIIGFGRLRKTGAVCDIGRVEVIDERKSRGIEAAIVSHLIEHAGVKKAYVPPGLVDHLRKRGFTISKKQPKEFSAIRNIECNVKAGRGSVLMVYDKK